MPMTRRSPARRLVEPRGAILIICLMLMLITAILAGIILFLSRTEATISANTRAHMQAANAAEYGIQFALSGIDSTNPNNPPFSVQCLTRPYIPPCPFSVQVTDGLGNGAQAGATSQGVCDCPPGYSLTLQCSCYRITATGWAQGWLSPRASTQIETVEAMYQGSRGTEHSN